MADPKSPLKPTVQQDGSRSRSAEASRARDEELNAKAKALGDRYARGVSEALTRVSLRAKAEQDAKARKARSGG